MSGSGEADEATRRRNALTDFQKKLIQHKELESRVCSMRENLRASKKEFAKTEDDLKSLQNFLFVQPGYVVNQVTAGNYDCPRKVLEFLTDLHAAFCMLNLRNDFLRKKFDGMKYDLRKVEIRGLAAKEGSTKDTGVQDQS